jgi:hypothetical protein
MNGILENDGKERTGSNCTQHPDIHMEVLRKTNRKPVRMADLRAKI